MLAVTKFVVDRLVAGKGTTVKDIASKFKAKNADVIGMLEAVCEDGEMQLATDTEGGLLARTKLAVVKLSDEIAGEYGIESNYGKPADYFMLTLGGKNMTEAVAPVVDESGATLTGGDVADGEGAVGAGEWYEGPDTSGTTNGEVVKTGRKTKTREEILAAEEAKKAAKAAKAAEREQAKTTKAAERQAALAAGKAAREAAQAERKAARDAKRAEALAAKGHAEGTCRVCHKPLTAEESAARGIGAICLANLAKFSGAYTAENLRDEETVDDDTLENLVAQFAEYKKENTDRERFATEAEAMAAHPEGIVKIGAVWNAVKAAGISPLLIMKASGGEFGLGEVLLPGWNIFLVGANKRYFSANVMQDFEALKTLKPKKAEKPAKATKEAPVAEGAQA